MKKYLGSLLVALLLAGCGASPVIVVNNGSAVTKQDGGPQRPCADC